MGSVFSASVLNANEIQNRKNLGLTKKEELLKRLGTMGTKLVKKPQSLGSYGGYELVLFTASKFVTKERKEWFRWSAEQEAKFKLTQERLRTKLANKRQ